MMAARARVMEKRISFILDGEDDGQTVMSQGDAASAMVGMVLIYISELIPSLVHHSSGQRITR